MKYDMSNKKLFVLNPGTTETQFTTVFFDTVDEVKEELQRLANEIIDERRELGEFYDPIALEYVDISKADWKEIDGVLVAHFEEIDWDTVHIW